jgi:cell wall-associated NlpC family hydrolase
MTLTMGKPSAHRTFCRCGVLILLCATFALGKTNTQVVVVPVANLYSGPSEKNDVVSQAIYGSNVQLVVARGEWSRIETADHYKGWVPSRHIRTILTGDGYATSGPVVQVQALFANIYSEPNVTRHKPVITVPYEARLEVVSQDGDSAAKPATAASKKVEGWLQVRLPGKTTAWIQSSDVSAEMKLLSIPESIELAKRFLGIPYLWGGTSSFGFDCSGFTQMIMRSRGINMPRDADQQAAWTGVAAVERKDLHAGDLLFFGSSPKDITHTGMYIGEGQFIHDTTHEHAVVQISRIDDDPWTRLLVACRRAK